jgi:HK97 family phage prohead protease
MRRLPARVTELVGSDEFHRLARGGRARGVPVLLAQGNAVRQVDEQRRAVTFVFSDGSVDRMGDTINPDGWDLRDFKANPVALWAHDSYAPPIGRAARIFSDGRRLIGDVEFAPAEAYPFAETIYQMVAGGWLNAVSVGFLPLEWTWSNDPDRPSGIDFKRQQLLEISVCPVPANANALAEARANGINTRSLIGWAAGAARRGVISGAQLREFDASNSRAFDPPRDRAADLAAVAARRARLLEHDRHAAVRRKLRAARALHERLISK